MVIGLSVLAYRMEGLRRTDFDALLNSLYTSLGSEQGAMNERPTAARFKECSQLPKPILTQRRIAQSEAGAFQDVHVDISKCGHCTAATFIEYWGRRRLYSVAKSDLFVCTNVAPSLQA